MSAESPTFPTTWRKLPLSLLATYAAGRTPARAEPTYWEATDGEGVPWVSIGDMKAYRTLTKTSERVTHRAVSQVFGGRLVKRGTLLMSFKLSIGRVSTLGVDALHNEAIVAIYPTPEVDQKYLEFFLSQVDWTEYQDRAIKGNTLNRDKIDRISVSLPPLSEQHRIAAILWKVQRAIEVQEQLVATVRELKQAAMRELFTRGLHGEAQKETEIGLVPENWEVTPVNSHFTLTAGGTPSRSEARFWDAGTVPWVKTAEVDYADIYETEEKITNEGLQNSAAKLIPAGTVLVAMYGQGITRGRVAMLAIDAATNQACVACLPRDGSSVTPRFLYFVLQDSYERLRNLAHGGQQQNLNKDLVAGFPIPVPPTLAEQHEIATALHTIDRKLAHHERKRDTLQDLFKTLLHELMTGHIRVHELDLDITEPTAGLTGGEAA